MELKGMPVVESIAKRVKDRIGTLADRGIVPTLAVIRVGEKPEDISYERGIVRRFAGSGCEIESIHLEVGAGEKELLDTIENCNRDSSIHGILLFRPLPEGMDTAKIENAVAPVKDVDCMCMTNMAHVFAQDGEGYAPCTPAAVMELVKYYGIELQGKTVAVIGRSLVVGKPLAMMLQRENATVVMCHRKTVNIQEICRSSDIIVAAAGSAHMVKREWVREGQVLIDVGINMLDGRLVGDIDYEETAQVVDKITPVPGGVGTVTTSVLLLHTLIAAEKYNDLLIKM